MTLYTYIASQGRKRVPAEDVELDATGFTGNLTTSDSNCQLVAEAVDSLVISASRALMVYSHPGGAQPSGTNYMSGFTADYTNGSFITINTASGYDKFVIGEAGSYLLTFSLRIGEIGSSSSYIRLYKNAVIILRGTGQYYTGNGGADSVCYVLFITGAVNDEYYFDFTEASNAIIQGFQVIFEKL